MLGFDSQFFIGNFHSSDNLGDSRDHGVDSLDKALHSRDATKFNTFPISKGKKAPKQKLFSGPCLFITFSMCDYDIPFFFLVNYETAY